LLRLLDVDEVKNLTKGIDSTQRVEVLINVGDHLESFPIKLMFFNEQIQNWGLAVICDDFSPPNACGGVSIHFDDCFGFIGPIRCSTEMGVDDFFGLGPRIFVCNWLDAPHWKVYP
jgi:hypothetical protein